jgi:hypothetical protein
LDEVVCSKLAVTELPRAVRHKAAVDRRVNLRLSLGRAEVLLSMIALHPVGRLALWRAGRLFDPHLRSLDAIHVMTALELRPISAFVSYDHRQLTAARAAGLVVRSPGA